MALNYSEQKASIQYTLIKKQGEMTLSFLFQSEFGKKQNFKYVL